MVIAGSPEARGAVRRRSGRSAAPPPPPHSPRLWRRISRPPPAAPSLCSTGLPGRCSAWCGSCRRRIRELLRPQLLAAAARRAAAAHVTAPAPCLRPTSAGTARCCWTPRTAPWAWPTGSGEAGGPQPCRAAGAAPRTMLAAGAAPAPAPALGLSGAIMRPHRCPCLALLQRCVPGPDGQG